MARAPGLGGLDWATLSRRPEEPVRGTLGGHGFCARIGIRRYRERVRRRYGADAGAAAPPPDFAHLGLVVEFATPIEVVVHDRERALDAGLRRAVARFGPLILRNARLGGTGRGAGQRNIFPSLSFHIDRARTQADHYSLFWRDPCDPVQRAPRTSSTPIVPNALAYPQARRQGEPPHEFRSRYDLFVGDDVAALVGDIVLEQPWRAAEGTGEICNLDNRTVPHASCYARRKDKGYPIGVRYLF